MNKRHQFIIMGLIGLSITLVLNIFMTVVLGVGGEAWWSWWPYYIVWLVLLVIGLGLSK